MKKIQTLLLVAVVSFSCTNEMQEKKAPELSQENSESDKITVLTLGCFHFNFPNLDVEKIEESDQIDVLDPKYQEEIQIIVDQLAEFKPTIIAIERKPKYQEKYDSLYNSYLEGSHELTRSEEQQIGFRLAKRFNLKTLYCTDTWGGDLEEIKDFFESEDTIAQQEFLDFFYHNPDTLKMSFRRDEALFKTEGIIAELDRINSEDQLARSLGDYLIGVFKYEIPGNDQFGPDFTTGWWFNRNLRIFRNIQKIHATPEDRILVIYGAGHMNLLNIFFEVSPEYQLIPLKEYLN